MPNIISDSIQSSSISVAPELISTPISSSTEFPSSSAALPNSTTEFHSPSVVHSDSASPQHSIPSIIQVSFADDISHDFATSVSNPIVSPLVPDDSSTSISHSIVSPLVADSILATRKSSRPRKTPSYLNDFHCQLVLDSTAKPNLSSASLSHSPGTPHSLSSSLTYDHLSPSHRAYVLPVSTHIELTHF